MSILETGNQPSPASDETDAIAALQDAFATQRRAFAADRFPPLAERRRRIEALMGMMATYRVRINKALSQDFGVHPEPASDLIEVLGVLGRARYVLENLETWMQPEPRATDPGLHGTARAYIQHQPKGVVGNIVPWNFPFDLSVGPMVEMLAAGNRVTVKPSEYTPRCAELLAEMVAATFPRDLVHVATGGLVLARAFSAVPWDHLLYTGSPDVGRLVMQAAARNLTPVTLELGGKCPALFTPGAVAPANVASVIGTKLVKSGQMCVSVDYCLLHRSEMPAFVEQAQAFARANAPDYARGPDCTGIISERHFDRLQGLLDEARQRQVRVVVLEHDATPERSERRMPLTLVIDPPGDLRLMHEEIFGPILPVVPYDRLAQAIEGVNDRDRPLGLYVFGDDPALTEAILAQTSSGGAAVNTCAMQSALPSLGFGGSGTSGMGRHHGIEGFREFSNPRGVFVRGEGDSIHLFYPPYENAAQLVQTMLPD